MNNKALEVLVDNLHERVVRLENAHDVHDLWGQLHDLEEYLGIEYQPPATQPARYVKKAAGPPKGGYDD